MADHYRRLSEGQRRVVNKMTSGQRECDSNPRESINSTTCRATDGIEKYLEGSGNPTNGLQTDRRLLGLGGTGADFRVAFSLVDFFEGGGQRRVPSRTRGAPSPRAEDERRIVERIRGAPLRRVKRQGRHELSTGSRSWSSRTTVDYPGSRAQGTDEASWCEPFTTGLLFLHIRFSAAVQLRAKVRSRWSVLSLCCKGLCEGCGGLVQLN